MRKFLYKKLKLPKRLARIIETSRIIKRRWARQKDIILVSCWESYLSNEEKIKRFEAKNSPHIYHKWNMRCGCHICSYKESKSFHEKKIENIYNDMKLDIPA